MAYALDKNANKIYVVGEGDPKDFSFSTLTGTAGCVQFLDDAKGNLVFLTLKPL